MPKPAATQRILDPVKRRPGMTELEIARELYGASAVQQNVNPECRMLVSLGLLERRGVGGPGDPFTYHEGNGISRPSFRAELHRLKRG